MSQAPPPGPPAGQYPPPQPGAAPYGHPPGVGGPPPPTSKGSSATLWIVLGTVAVVLLLCGGLLTALLVPAVQAAREAARRVGCANQMKEISLAMHMYHDDYKSFPPPYTTDANGTPLHSWRTLILPYVEQQALYESIDLSKPWDDPVNANAAATSVPIYACPSGDDALRTTYQAVVDPDGVMAPGAGLSFGDVLDGTSNTLLFCETEVSQAVPWMSPQDTTRDAFVNVSGTSAGQGGHQHLGGGHIAMVDGFVKFLSKTADPETREALVTRKGSEVIYDY